MKIQKFDGGLATRLDPQFLDVNEAAEYINIDNSLGSLSPVKDKISDSISKRFNWFSVALNRWFSSDTYTSYTEYDNQVYSVNGSTPLITDNSSIYPMGIASPAAFTAQATNAPTPVTDCTLNSTITVTGIPNQDTTYLLINENDGIYSKAFVVNFSASLVPKPLQSYLTMLNGVNPITGATIDDKKRTIVISNPRTEILGNAGIHVFRQYRDIWYRVGTLTTLSSSLTDNIEDISANLALDKAKGLNLSGTYQYVMTYYDSIRGRESGPSPVSNEVVIPNSGSVQLSVLPISTNITVNKKRIYRVGGELTSFSLVAEISNSDTSYIDNIADLDIQGDILSSQEYLPAPNNLTYLVQANGMMFASQGSKLRYTPIGVPEAWPELYFIQFESNITGLAVCYTGIIVCTVNKTFLVTGSGPSSLVPNLISADQGSVNLRGMQVYKGTAIWVSNSGICASSGEEVRVISKNQLGNISLSPVDSVLANEVYYVVNSNNIIYSFDTALGPIFKKFDLGINSIAKRGSDLYGHNAGNLYKLFASAVNTSFSYKSPRFIEGSFCLAKTYKDIYIYSKGDIIVKIYVNDVLVTNQVLNGEDNHTVFVPQEDLRGNYIQFEIQGTGTVFEVEYSVGRNDG